MISENTTVRKIPAIKPLITHQTPSKNKKRKTCGYARVSSDGDRQLHSYSSQMDYYKKFICEHDEWEYVGMYYDESITGTSIVKRDGFKQMLSDAYDGKIDLIITKSFSRFARNTVDSLTAIRTLREKGIEIFFEKENIWTLDTNGEFLITIMSSLAQEESRSISENVKWGKRKKMAEGKVYFKYDVFLGYDKGPDGGLVINPEQAETVKEIYRLFMSGLNMPDICHELTRQGRKAPAGIRWHPGTIKKILTNEKYKGDALLQKYITTDFLTRKQIKNTGEVQQYYVQEHHEPIIEPEVWDSVQVELEKRIAAWRAYQCVYKGMRPLTRLVRCKRQGQIFHHTTNGAVAYGNDGIWYCDKDDCPHRLECELKSVPDTAVQQSCKRALGITIFDEKLIKERIEVVEIPKDGWLTVKLKDGTIYEDYFRGYKDNVEKQPVNKNCFSRKLICGKCGEYFNTTIVLRDGIRRVTWNCKKNADNSFIHENVLKFRVADAARWDKFSYDRFREEVDHIDMDKPCHMVIHFKDGSTKEAEYYANYQPSWRGRHGSKNNKDTGN